MDVSDTSSLHFSEDDIRTQLEQLGYQNVPKHRLLQFAKDLEKLIANESMQGQQYNDDSTVSGSYSSAAEFPTQSHHRTIPPSKDVHREPDMPTPYREALPSQAASYNRREPSDISYRPARSTGREPADIENRGSTRPDYTKQQIHTQRDHTIYGKENHTDYRPEIAPSYNPSRPVTAPSYNPSRPVSAPSYHPSTRHDADELLESSFASSRSESVDYQQRRPKGGGAQWADKKAPMKRKVLRKKGGHSQIFDESITESEADLTADISYLNDRLHEIPLPSHDFPDTDSILTDTSDASSDMVHRRKPETSSTLYSHRPSGDEDTVFKPHLPRSFIRPSSAQPKSRHNQKTDPVSRHQMYQAAWNAKKAPGEKTRKDLRWSVREQMMYKDELPKPQNQPRVYVPNSYKVPTDKKRQALRWAVRTSLAQKQMPNSSAFEF